MCFFWAYGKDTGEFVSRQVDIVALIYVVDVYVHSIDGSEYHRYGSRAPWPN